MKKKSFFKLAKLGLKDVFGKSGKIRKVKVFDLLSKLLPIVKEIMAIIKDIKSLLSCKIYLEKFLSFQDS
jgi:hypothetical protein